MLPPVNFKTIKQPSGSRCCAAAVAAMAVGKPLDYVLNLVPDIRHKTDNKRWLRTRDLLMFLGRHGIVPGININTKGVKINVKDVLKLEYSIEHSPALLTVPSKVFKDSLHYVFWDGEFVRDPNPLTPDTTKLEWYNIIEIAPLTYIDESKEFAWQV